jgi:hypothetical protein
MRCMSYLHLISWIHPHGSETLTEDVSRPNFFFSSLTFFAELAQEYEYVQDLATVTL